MSFSWGPSGTDGFCYFYVYFLPSLWSGGMAICSLVDPARLGLAPGAPVRLGSRVPGMGCTSAVGVTQMAHRTMLRYVWSVERPVTSAGLPPLSLLPVFKASLEVRKDRAFPIQGHQGCKAAWSVRVHRQLDGG